MSSTLSSLTGPAVKSLVPPGRCQLTDEFSSLQLLDRVAVSATSSVLRFALADAARPLDLSTCACILAKADLSVKKEDGTSSVEPVVRPYTPISTNALVGSFDLLVKNYGADGLLSTHLVDSLKVGDTVDFKHISFNVKIQAPFPQRRVAMIVGGTGVTPMLQALHAILGDAVPVNQQVDVLYGSRHAQDILGKELLDAWERTHPDRLRVTHVLSHEPEGSEWTGARGFLTKELVQASFPGPKEDVIVFVCGPPVLYDIFCGPRTDPELSGILQELGYTKEQVVKF